MCGDTVAQGLAPASQLEGPGFYSWTWSLSVWGLHVLQVSVWVLYGFSGFLPQPKNMNDRLIEHSKSGVSNSFHIVGHI